MSAQAYADHDSPAEEEDLAARLAGVRPLLQDEDEKRRMQGLLLVREWEALDAEALAVVNALSHDDSRSVRTLARDILKAQGQDIGSRQEARERVAKQASRGAVFLSLISLGSAGTGLIATAMSFVSYYTLGRFPFPDPLAVLFWLNVVLTLPFVVVGILVLLPGRGPRLVAGAFAIASLLGCMAAMLFAQDVFISQWSFQFTVQKQQAYIAFLSPFRVAFMLLPIILGQSIMLYYVSSQRLVSTASAAPEKAAAR